MKLVSLHAARSTPEYVAELVAGRRRLTFTQKFSRQTGVAFELRQDALFAGFFG